MSDITGRELRYRARLPKEEKFRLLKALMGKESDAELASRLQCSTRTIGRLKKEFFESEEYRVQVQEEIHVLLHDPEISKYERLRFLIDLHKTMTLRIQMEKTVEGGDVEIVVQHHLPAVEPKQ